MSFSIVYRPFVEVKLFHRYFLDDGETPFDQSVSIQEKQLSKYNAHNFLSIVPTAQTQQALNGHKIVFKKSKDGFVLFINSEKVGSDPDTYIPLIAPADDLKLNFLVYARDSLFENYSEIKAINPIPYLFSNYIPSTAPASFPLINRMSDMVPAKDFTIALPTYEHFEDQISKAEKIGLLGIVSLGIKGNSTVYHLTLVSGNLPQNLPQFKILFNNRRTFWRYYRNGSNTPEHTTEPALKPLTANGTVPISLGATDYPNPSPGDLFFEKDGAGNIIKTFSEIYI